MLAQVGGGLPRWAVMNMSGLLGGCRAEDKSRGPGLGQGVRRAPVTGIVERRRRGGRRRKEERDLNRHLERWQSKRGGPCFCSRMLRGGGCPAHSLQAGPWRLPGGFPLIDPSPLPSLLGWLPLWQMLAHSGGVSTMSVYVNQTFIRVFVNQGTFPPASPLPSSMSDHVSQHTGWGRDPWPILQAAGWSPPIPFFISKNLRVYHTNWERRVEGGCGKGPHRRHILESSALAFGQNIIHETPIS